MDWGADSLFVAHPCLISMMASKSTGSKSDYGSFSDIRVYYASIYASSRHMSGVVANERVLGQLSPVQEP